MKVFVNEKELELDAITILDIVDELNVDYDIAIVNGFAVDKDYKINHLDKITFIKKGVQPTKEELEHLMVSRHTPRVYEKLKVATIAVIGLGGLGSNVAISLARIGVGNLILLDYDVVEPSNLNRQQYYYNQIGMKKTAAIKEIIDKINPFVKVKLIDKFLVKDDIKNLFSNVDILIEAVDNSKTKAMIANEVLLNLNNVKLIGASGMSGYYSNNTIITKKINDRFYLCGDLINEAKVGCGLMAPRVSICANHQANMAVRLLLGENEV